MWLLKECKATPGQVHQLVCGPPLVVGRKVGHILLTNDNSISRKHATFTLTFPAVNLKTKKAAKVELKDLESKYGTFINGDIEKGQRLSPGATLELHHGDRIRFGVLGNTWRLEHQDLTVTTSTLKNEGRQQLHDALLVLGGHLRNDWSSDCCYLVMPSITLTVKVACALAAGRNIVLPEFFTKLADTIIQKADPPKPSQFLPPVLEMKISTAGASFSPDLRRSSLFAGLTFLFPTLAQMTRMCAPVQLAGGQADLLAEDNYQEVASGKCLLITISAESQHSNALYTKACDLLEQRGLRTVPEAEIGLAILFVSIEGHCNSAFKHADIFKRSSSISQPSEKLKIFATETQEEESVSLTGSRVVPDSGGRQQTTTAQNETTAGRLPLKRPLPGGDGGGGEAKRSNTASLPDVTQPLSTQELSDEDIPKDDIKIECEETFKPEHSSTQITNPPPSTSVDQSAIASFAPYTLPSLKTLEPEEEEETQPYCPDRSQEAFPPERKSDPEAKREETKVKINSENELKFDEWWRGEKEEDAGKKRPRSEEESPEVQETKKTKADGFSNRITVHNNGHQNSDEMGTKRKAMEEENIFALPPRSRERERRMENMTTKHTSDSELFALPTRTSRTRRLPSHPDSALVPPTLPPTPAQDTPAIPSTPAAKPDVTSRKENIPPSKFIDREQTTALKECASTGEVTSSRTVVVVESLVMQVPSPPPPTTSLTSSKLPNFKVFKKVNATCILKVIGGSDFVEHDMMPAASQEFKIDAHLSRPEQPLQDDDLFSLADVTRRRRR